LSLYDKETAKTAGTFNNRKGASPGGNGNGPERKPVVAAKSNSDQKMLTVEAATAVLCPVGSTQNPQWAGMPLGEILKQTNGERMLAYLAGEQFNANGDHARKLAKEAARLLLSQAEKVG
jgi:hypothetical protein